MDINYFDKLWKENKYTMGSTSNENEAFWDKQADSMKDWKEKQKQDHQKKMIRFLEHKKMLQPDFLVLDIGCGPGKHSKNFARVAKKVVGTDISGKMLEYAQQNAAEEKLSNTEFVKIDWDEADLSKLNWERKFDLVFASMTPAIGGKESLEKMIRASRKYCFTSYAVSMQMPVREGLEAHINKELEKKHDPLKTIYSLVNMLFLLGYYPEIHYGNQQWKSEMTIDRAMEHFKVNKPNDNGEVSSEKISAAREYFEKISVDGLIKEVVDAKIAWVSWEV